MSFLMGLTNSWFVAFQNLELLLGGQCPPYGLKILGAIALHQRLYYVWEQYPLGTSGIRYTTRRHAHFGASIALGCIFRTCAKHP